MYLTLHFVEYKVNVVQLPNRFSVLAATIKPKSCPHRDDDMIISLIVSSPVYISLVNQ